MPPQQRRHHLHRIEEPAAHAQKAHLQGKPQLGLRSAAFLDDPGHLGRELEEHFDLAGSHLARQVPQNVACQLSSRTSVEAAQYTPSKRNQQVIESESRMATDLCTYWQKLRYVIAPKMRRPRRAH